MHAGDLDLAEIELQGAAAGLARGVGPEHTLTLTALEQLALDPCSDPWLAAPAA